MAHLGTTTIICLLALLGRCLAIDVILYAKAAAMKKEATRTWTSPAHTCDKPEERIVDKMASWSGRRYTAQMGTGRNARVVVRPVQAPDSEAAAQSVLADMEGILARNVKQGWCERLVAKAKDKVKDKVKDKLKKGKGKGKRSLRRRRQPRGRRSYGYRRVRKVY